METESKTKKLPKDTGILEGSLWKALLRFAIPLACTSLLQLLFNSADMAVVGRYVGSVAVAAVASNVQVINLIVGLFTGLSVGANAVIARSIGQRDPESIEKTIHTAILLAVLSGVFLMIFGISVTDRIHVLMGTPDDVVGPASMYLRVYFAGCPFMMLYNFSSSIMRSKGDTRRPLIVIAISGVLNVILNIIFVTQFHRGVEGVALATAIANGVSAVCLLVMLSREPEPMKFSLRRLRIDGSAFRRICAIGIPSGLQGMVFSISNVAVQRAINSLGSQVMAASGAAGNFEGYVYWIFYAFCMSLVTFVSQNYGAGNIRRARQSVRVGWACAGIVTAVLVAIIILFRGTLIQIFITKNEPEVIEIAMVRMLILMPFELLNMTMSVFPSGLRGFGHSLMPAIISMVGACGLRILWIATVFEHYHTFMSLLLIYPISWGITALVLGIAYLRVARKIQRQYDEAAEGQLAPAEG